MSAALAPKLTRQSTISTTPPCFRNLDRYCFGLLSCRFRESFLPGSCTTERPCAGAAAADPRRSPPSADANARQLPQPASPCPAIPADPRKALPPPHVGPATTAALPRLRLHRRPRQLGTLTRRLGRRWFLATAFDETTDFGI
jgi:hypothetical protein